VYSRHARADGAHYYPWHSDIAHERLVGLSVNLSSELFEGGVLEVREERSRRVVARVANRTAGDAVLFRISPVLEHHVTPVTAGGERLVLAGWFRRAPDFWQNACASS
jgi:predicted 2-oxoglutarate/Fe(II)-dependent dioxygenase YbiX